MILDERFFHTGSRPSLPLEKRPGKHPRATTTHLLHLLPLLSQQLLQPRAQPDAPAADTVIQGGVRGGKGGLEGGAVAGGGGVGQMCMWDTELQTDLCFFNTLNLKNSLQCSMESR